MGVIKQKLEEKRNILAKIIIYLLKLEVRILKIITVATASRANLCSHDIHVHHVHVHVCDKTWSRLVSTISKEMSKIGSMSLLKFFHSHAEPQKLISQKNSDS